MSSDIEMFSRSKTTRLPLPVALFVANVVVLFSLHLASGYFYKMGFIPEHRLELPAGVPSFFAQGDDSWRPMLLAADYLKSTKKDTVYEALFFKQKVKFQYPPTAILPVMAIQSAHPGNWLMPIRILKLTAALALILYVGCATAMVLVGPTIGKGSRFMTAVTIVVAALLFYPMMRGYNLGQLQTIISALFALAFLCFLTGKEAAAGLLIGVMTLMKPQYVIIILWSVLRRKKRLASAAILCVVCGCLGSLLLFGVSNNVDYLRVLKFIGEHGESYYANQSVNGLLNRLCLNGDSTLWTKDSFPPYRPVVYMGTAIASLLIVVSSLALPRRAPGKGGALDFALITLACTIASPVAWEHHYGVAFPIFVWLFVNSDRMSRSSWILVSISFLLIGADLSIANLTAEHPPFNILQSYVLMGGLVLAFLLHRLTRAREMNAVSGLAIPEGVL